MTPGLKFSFAARAAVSRAGRSSSLQWIRRRAKSREMGDPGCRPASSGAHDVLCSWVAFLMTVRVTMLGSAVCGCIESYNSGQGSVVGECYRDVTSASGRTPVVQQVHASRLALGNPNS